MFLKWYKDGIYETILMPTFFFSHYSNCIFPQCLDFSKLLFTMMLIFLVFYLSFLLKQKIFWASQEARNKSSIFFPSFL